MRNIAVGVFRAVLKPSRRHSCRWVAGSRHAINRRSFHRSTVTCQTPNQLPTSDENSIAARSIPRHVSPAPTEAGTKVSNTDNVQEGHGEEDGHIAHATAVETDHLLKEDADTLEDGDTARTGTRSKRQWSRKRPPPQGLPPVSLPPWFIENNIIRFDATTTHRTDLAVANSISSEPQDTEAGDALEQASDSKRFSRAADRVSECQLAPVEEAKYAINVDVYLEVAAAIRSALSMRPDTGFADKKLLPRPVTMLHCPKDGGTMFLDSVVQTISSKLEADLLVVDAQDIAQIVGPYLDENQAWLPSSTALLGYTTQKFAGKLEELEEEVDDSEDADETQGSEGLDITRHSAPSEARHPLSNSIFKVITSSLDNLPQFMSTSVPGTGRSPSDRLGSQLKLFVPDSIGSFPKPGSTQWLDLKANNVLEAIVDSIYAKAQSAESAPSRKVIVQIKDFKEIISSPNGFELMNKLRNIIDRRWSEGKDIIMLGTTSTEADGSAITKVEIQHAQIDTVNGERRTIIVPPHHSNSFESDERARIRQINVRHIEDMIRQLAQGSSLTPPAVDIEEDLSTDEAYLGGLEDAVWMHSSVQRIASTILGLETPQGVINGPIFAKAVDLLASSDEAKFEWSLKELQQEDLDVEELEARENEAAAATLRGNKMNQAKLKKIKKDATTHEAKFLGGVIMPADIKTTFSSVHAPKETIDALKTLTSLSLIRPEAFAYGVLATDKIPGLLLYGPPGTGKTLLAKAVARESGATVLEVSGADVNDMYVGESEKNVKAVFSLAKKLSPCVVFIDEADAIFAARGGEGRRSQVHRDLINQFLREWDGMNDLSAFIMVATNRPFDLDEAVLRRLPRRLLVDLPVGKDREAILRIHLKDEKLDSSFSLEQLALATPYYSGSDLKNLCVAAAMACIREEMDTAAKHVGETPYSYPERRTLSKRHFDKAIEEISSSISDDMSTLAAIRKFDEKYGDRKGRRKKRAAMGFAGTSDPEKDSEAGRVRKIEA